MVQADFDDNVELLGAILLERRMNLQWKGAAGRYSQIAVLSLLPDKMASLRNWQIQAFRHLHLPWVLLIPDPMCYSDPYSDYRFLWPIPQTELI